MIYAIGGALAFFLGVLLLGKRGKQRADRILAAWIFVLGGHLFLYYCIRAGIAEDFPALYGISMPFPFLHGPFLLLYTLSQISTSPSKSALNFLHFLPIPIFYLYYLPFFGWDHDRQMAYVQKVTNGEGDLFFQVLFPLVIFSGVIYIGCALFLLYHHRKRVKEEFSETHGINLAWLANLVLGMAAIWLVVGLSHLVIGDLHQDDAIYLSVVIFVLAIGYFGIRQKGIFTEWQRESIPSGNPAPEGQALRYQKSGLKKEQVEGIWKTLEKYMEENKPYLESGFSLKNLAEACGMSTNHISQVINQGSGKNFHDFVNTYRLEAFKQKVAVGAHKEFTLLALAFECGFGSKATFNKFCKKELGMTPTQYIKSLPPN